MKRCFQLHTETAIDWPSIDSGADAHVLHGRPLWAGILSIASALDDTNRRPKRPASSLPANGFVIKWKKVGLTCVSCFDFQKFVHRSIALWTLCRKSFECQPIRLAVGPQIDRIEWQHKRAPKVSQTVFSWLGGWARRPIVTYPKTKVKSPTSTIQWYEFHWNPTEDSASFSTWKKSELNETIRSITGSQQVNRWTNKLLVIGSLR